VFGRDRESWTGKVASEYMKGRKGEFYLLRMREVERKEDELKR
jgi:hypothetical protein